MTVPDSPVLIALDLETTGLHPQLSEIVEIGAATFNPLSGEIIDSFQTLVDPGCPIPMNVQAIHGINDSMVAGAPRIVQAFEMLEEFLGGHSIVVGHNISFDLGFLRYRANHVGRPLRFLRCIDTVHLARWAFPGLKSYKLVALRTALGLPEDSAHRALDDAIASAALFSRGYRQLLSMSHPEEVIWTRLLKAMPEGRVAPASLTAELRELYSHCELGTRLLIRYRNAQAEISLRVVDPQGMQLQHNGHTLVGYCHLKQASRHFRCDRILHWQVADDRDLEELLPLQLIVPEADYITADPPIEVF